MRKWGRGNANRRHSISFSAIATSRVNRKPNDLHPFNDVNMAYGSASCGAEFVEDIPKADIFVIPVGGGGLIAGMAAAIKHHNPKVQVIGVEPKGANSLLQSFLSGQPQALRKVNTIADSLGAPCALMESFELARANVDEIIEIEDQVMVQTMQQMRIV